MAKLWKAGSCDVKFSKWIRGRAGICESPDCITPLSGLTCSHFYGRIIYPTRYDVDNCMCICTSCHRILEPLKGGRYREIMIERLGEEGFDDLYRRAHELDEDGFPLPMSERLRGSKALEAFMEWWVTPVDGISPKEFVRKLR